MTYFVRKIQLDNENIVVVGCGGTGAFVADGLCRLTSGKQSRIVLVDSDRVQPENLVRQNFYKEDLGRFKSQVMAERLSRKYNRAIAYSVLPFMGNIDLGEIDMSISYGNIYQQLPVKIVIGCVDNTAARKAISNSVQSGTWWIDAGNGYSSGQVLIGNVRNPEQLKRTIDEENHIVNSLPLPSLQLPDIIIPPTIEIEKRPNCAQAVAAGDQSPVINQFMAALVLEFIYRLTEGTLPWMGAYIDMNLGTLHTVSVEPKTISRICKVGVDALTFIPNHICKIYSMQGGEN